MLQGKEGTPQDRGEGVKFERIRRITGYLTGDLRTWNSSKRAEVKDRVKHA
jgi:anaerobic ribonucleoside-triphosphate reductase